MSESIELLCMTKSPQLPFLLGIIDWHIAIPGKADIQTRTNTIDNGTLVNEGEIKSPNVVANKPMDSCSRLPEFRENFFFRSLQHFFLDNPIISFFNNTYAADSAKGTFKRSLLINLLNSLLFLAIEL